MLPQYTPLRQPSTQTYDDHNHSHNHDQEDYLESLQNIPSNFDQALNGHGGPHPQNQNRFLSPHPSKAAAESSLLEPDTLRRLSMSTISSLGRTRSVSPYPHLYTSSSTPRSWKLSLWNFWDQNQGLFLVTFSQLFGALMNVTTRLLELEGEGMHPFQILFARQGLTAIFCTAWM